MFILCFVKFMLCRVYVILCEIYVMFMLCCLCYVVYLIIVTKQYYLMWDAIFTGFSVFSRVMEVATSVSLPMKSEQQETTLSSTLAQVS